LIRGEAGPLQLDVANPVLGFYPMSKWVPGEIVRDDYVISLPLDQAYNGAQTVVYRPAGTGFENLGVADITLPTTE